MLRALIVDDDNDMRFLVRMTIEAANHGLTVAGEAATGTEAIASIEQDRPGVVVLDYRMPGMSGLETAEAILRDDPTQPIILFSAYLDAETVERAHDLGIRTCLAKTEVDRLPETLWQLAAGA
jgi:DNA-binding NarL/FixJ family response regulator